MTGTKSRRGGVDTQGATCRSLAGVLGGSSRAGEAGRGEGEGAATSWPSSCEGAAGCVARAVGVAVPPRGEAGETATGGSGATPPCRSLAGVLGGSSRAGEAGRGDGEGAATSWPSSWEGAAGCVARAVGVAVPPRGEAGETATGGSGATPPATGDAGRADGDREAGEGPRGAATLAGGSAGTGSEAWALAPWSAGTGSEAWPLAPWARCLARKSDKDGVPGFVRFRGTREEGGTREEEGGVGRKEEGGFMMRFITGSVFFAFELGGSPGGSSGEVTGGWVNKVVLYPL